MWNRIKVEKHATFADADAARKDWLELHPNTDAGSLSKPSQPQYKARIKARPDTRFDFVVW